MYAKPPGSSTKSFLSQNNFLCLIQPQGNFMRFVSFSSFLGALWSPSFLQQEELRFRGNSHTTFHPFLGLLDSFLCNVLGAFEEMIMTSGYFPSFMTKHGATMPWQASHRIWGWTAVTNTDGLLWHRPKIHLGSSWLHPPMIVLQLHKWTYPAWHVGSAVCKTRGRVRSSATILAQSV